MKKIQIPLMPKGTAFWLKLNTTLSTEQIATFCHMTLNEVELVSERDCIAYNPISLGQLTAEVITKCEQNPSAKLKLTCDIPQDNQRSRHITRQQQNNMLGYLRWFVERGVSTEKVARMLKKRHATIEKQTQEALRLNIKEIHPQDGCLLTNQEIDELIKDNCR